MPAEIANPKSSNPSSRMAADHRSARQPVFDDAKHGIKIFQGDALEILPLIPEDSVDLIFADPPYFLSNGGITCHAGRRVSVNKGAWDRSPGADPMHEFNRRWLAACQRVLKPDGTIWVSGTAHVIHSVGFAMQQLGMKLLNDITWVKPNPPPNLSCRYFTHATETLIWAAKDKKSRHTFNYKLMREIAGGKQMKSVWTIAAPDRAEKRFGKHPTQKPIALIERVLLAASREGDLVLDPFMGSGTTAVAALRLRRYVAGIELDGSFVTAGLGRLCAELMFVRVSVLALASSLDLRTQFMDRSDRAEGAVHMMLPSKIVYQERKDLFIGADRREVVYSVAANSLDDAWSNFRASGCAAETILAVIKAETEIYLAQ
jgi:site-specific DNA-methyltransferase (adenine-specific)